MTNREKADLLDKIFGNRSDLYARIDSHHRDPTGFHIVLDGWVYLTKDDVDHLEKEYGLVKP